MLQDDLLNSYNEAFQKGKLSVSQRRGIISLIPKEDNDLSELTSWRPITLLNVDYKILAKTIAKRIEPFLPKLIHSDQTGFIKDRYVGQNIRLLSDLMEYTDAKKISGIFLFVDFEKAFDSIEWSFISNTLELFNFGASIRKWFSLLYNGGETAVMNAGYMTNYFKISRGVQQGCPLSPFLFILAVELLATKIRQLQDCKGILFPNHQEVKISQFADDTTLIMSDTTSLKFALQTLDNFGTISGLKLNLKKAMWIGSSKQKNIKILEFSVTKDPIKILGTYFSHNLNKNINANFYLKIRKMSTKLNLWRARELTLYGKSLLAKTLGASQLIYTASMICVPDTVINNVQGHLFSFLWNNRKDKIKRKVMYQSLSEGGINFINFRTMVKSLRLAWIKRLLTNSYDAWKAIPNYFF